MEECLTLKKGGKLVKTKWIYDEKKDKGNYIFIDVTDEAPTRLFDACELDADVTLRDIFLILNKELDIFNCVLRYWCREFVDEGLNKTVTMDNEIEDIEYLELCWYLNRDEFEGKKELYGNIFPYFHGCGYKDKKGNRIPYNISYIPVNEIIDLPLKLNKDYVIINEEKPRDKPIVFKGSQYSLGHILYGIIWEVSFNGSPKDRDEKSKKIQEEISKYEK